MAAFDAVRTPHILGLTGPIGCGKTTVGDILLGLGALARIDADHVVHALMTPETQVTRQIADRFGAVLAPDGSVDRAAVADVVFNDAAALHDLEMITHPAVRGAIREQIASFAGQPGVVVVDAVKLLQSDLLPLCEAVWVVQCDPAVQFDRLTRIRGMTPTAARRRMEAQPAFDHPGVSAVITNSGSLQHLRTQVHAFWQTLMERWPDAQR